MENKRFLEPFLLVELEIILRKKEQVLQELNGQLRGMRVCGWQRNWNQ